MYIMLLLTDQCTLSLLVGRPLFSIGLQLLHQRKNIIPMDLLKTMKFLGKAMYIFDILRIVTSHSTVVSYYTLYYVYS